ncbi:hypothetical protein EV199_0975 [Pseudobacter ginsenosidimutans]|uniref:Uncharacterized protein n=1 Tax=Pseudobacter ginsenosidimutans TaxID=661488 RepID=A0A4Q7N2M1_9BACT|nr:hypothetical protein EV199_0975 [Pseudobacter ginsenosidimutans]
MLSPGKRGSIFLYFLFRKNCLPVVGLPSGHFLKSEFPIHFNGS